MKKVDCCFGKSASDYHYNIKDDLQLKSMCKYSRGYWSGFTMSIEKCSESVPTNEAMYQ